VPSLIDAVTEAFTEMPVRTLGKCFFTLQAVMEAIMAVKGDNNYQLPRAGERFPDGNFPPALVCSETAYTTGCSG
jgi:hypothetical protein